MTRLLNNWNLKLMALVLSIALWSHVRGEMNPLETATFTAKVFAKNGDATISTGQTVRVTIRAPRVRLREVKGVLPANPLAAPDEAPPIASRYLTATVDLAEMKNKAGTLPVVIVNEIEDAEILGVKPAEIKLVGVEMKSGGAENQ